jgi:hypothetical protein
MRERMLKPEITSPALILFKSDNDAVKYCASRALITLDGGGKLGFHFIWLLLMPHPGDAQPSIPTAEIIAWLITTVGRQWRYRRTVKFLSEIIKNSNVALP